VPLFLLRCLDVVGAAAHREQQRAAHVAHVRGSGVVRMAGPMVNDSGAIVGSLMIIEVQDFARAQAFVENDPFRRAGVYGSVDIDQFRMTFTAPPQTAPDLGSAPQSAADRLDAVRKK